VGGFGGGLLIRPLLGATANDGGFREVFALLAVLAGTGVIFAAVYLLLATQRVFFGPVRHAENEHLRDLSLREGFVLVPLCLVAIFMGVFPKPFLDAVNPTVAAYTREFRARAGLPPIGLASAAPAVAPRPAGAPPPPPLENQPAGGPPGAVFVPLRPEHPRFRPPVVDPGPAARPPPGTLGAPPQLDLQRDLPYRRPLKRLERRVEPRAEPGRGEQP
jgi:hypothetical protein